MTASLRALLWQRVTRPWHHANEARRTGIHRLMEGAMTEAPRDLVRATLAIVLICGLGVTTLWVMRPFIPAIVWAATLVVASWPLMLRVQHRLWGRRSLAVIAMTLALLLAVAVPVSLAIGTIGAEGRTIVALSDSIIAFKVPSLPHWLPAVPVIGKSVAQTWANAAHRALGDLVPDLTPYAGQATRLLVAAIGGLGAACEQFLLTLVVAAILYARGEAVGAFAERVVYRIAGQRGDASLDLVVHAIRGVALGIVVSALIESALGGAALAAAGMPFAALLAVTIFVACVLQVGPGIVLFPATLWVFWQGDVVWAALLLVMTIIVIVLGNALRPILMKKQAQLPLLLILAGVLGGLAAFGLVGIFLGPTVLAVSHALLQAWLGEDAPLVRSGQASSFEERSQSSPGNFTPDRRAISAGAET